MSDVVITVRGEHETRIAPERAVAHLTVRTEGPDRGEVVDRVAALSDSMRADLVARTDAGALVEWTSGRVAAWSERPWSADGTRLAPVHYATVEFTATFADVAALSRWAGEVAERDGVQLGHIEWKLTPETRAAVERDVATAAVSVAVARATAYAEAIGRLSVVPLEIADVGLLDRAEAAPGGRMRLAAAFAADSAAADPAISLRPDDIVVSAAVEARFAAR